MSQTTITKSVRLSPVEAAKLARLSDKQAQSESSLIKKWILQGIQAEQMELAIQAYMRRMTDLRGGAAMAGVSYNRFMAEVQRRNIVILEDDHFLDNLEYLAVAFDNPALQAAVRTLREETEPTA
jgi:predicted HTH domain antitoxin